jgi:hypothetical protein
VHCHKKTRHSSQANIIIALTFKNKILKVEFDYTITNQQSLNFSAKLTENVSMTQLSSSLQLVDAFLGSNIA